MENRINLGMSNKHGIKLLIFVLVIEGLAVSSNAACTLVNVPNASYSANAFSTGDNYTYVCDTGYEHTAGDLTRTCQADGSWYGTTPVCSIVNCTTDDIADATKTPTTATIDYSQTVTYTCTIGYEVTSGNATRTCQDDGNLSGTAPVCSMSACLPPSAVVNGDYSPTQTTYAFGFVLTYSCDAGYYISSGNSSRTCQTNGLWDGTEPTCSRVSCNAPAAVPNSTLDIVQPVYDYGVTITYTCDLAYNHTSGNLVRTCQQDFAFSGSPPVCTRVACIQEPSTYMTLNPDETLSNFNVVVQYECILGYNHSSGDLSRTCQTNGEWSGTKPECVSKSLI